MRHPIDSMPEGLHRTYAEEELIEFKRDLTEAGNQKNILFLEYTLTRENFIELLGKLEWPILFIRKEVRIADEEKGHGIGRFGFGGTPQR